MRYSIQFDTNGKITFIEIIQSDGTRLTVYDDHVDIWAGPVKPAVIYDMMDALTIRKITS